MRIIQNKEDMISYYKLKKWGKKVGEAQNLGQKMRKIEKVGKKAVKNKEKFVEISKKLVLYAL